MTFLPPEPTSTKDLESSLEDLRKEHKQLVDDIVIAKQFEKTREVQQKQLKDHEEFLAKEQKRIEEWDKQVQAREYKLNAETGIINGNLQ